MQDAIVKKQLTFLVVEDDLPLSLLLKNMLLQADHQPFLAVNEHGAMEILKASSVDILLCDLMLPGLDGATVINIVKDHYPSLFCVLISGYGEDVVAKYVAQTRADMVIRKPILKETIEQIVKQYLLRHPETQL